MGRDVQGVGGRHSTGSPAPGGGGYLDDCKKIDFSDSDPRLDELREIGISRVWLNVAHQIGFDAFMEMWKILAPERDANNVKIGIPAISRYDAFQRNRLIEELTTQGMTAKEIRAYLKKNLCESLSIRHIKRILARRKIT